MTVLPHPMSSLHRGINTNPSTIQPTVKTILDLARRSDQHIVRLYYLPTPHTNGFATTHTLVSTTHTDYDRYPKAITTRNRSISLPYGKSHGGHDHQEDTSLDGHPRRILHLTRVSESDRGIVHLARLRISTMIIATSSIPYLSHLVSLRLQGNQLTDLPLEIFRLPSLRELDVSQNLLTELSGLIGLLAPTLEELFLQSNRLQCLPQQIGLLKRLRLLDIADNHLGCIPVEIQRLVSESLVSERRSLWRMNEAGLSLGNIFDDTWTLGEGSNNNLQRSIEHHHHHHHHHHNHQHVAQEQGVAPNNGIPNDEGGHDDDDYVQIRQGMKCWARGNRFWQVKAPRTPSAPLSPITATTTMLLAGPVSSTSSPSATSPSTPTSPFSLLDPAASSSAANQPGTTPMLPRLSASASQHTLFPGNVVGGSSSNSTNSDRQDLFGDAASHHGHDNQHRRDAFRYNHHPAHRQYPYNQHSSQQPHPEHLVDRRGYSKDSYTSCSWTLSLADICSQIVGEKLFDNPHYFCHVNACPYKKMREANAINAGADIIPDESQMDGCTMMMMPEWVTEQLGLHHLSELRKAVHGSDNSDQDDGAASSKGSGSTVDDAASSDWGTTAKEGIDLFSTNNKHDLLEIPAPMQLTLKEREMECEFCSVCQKRLYFAGMRWKGVGVMDERIVPLEWVACSVQCRSRAERGERRGGGGLQGSSKANSGSAAVGPLDGSSSLSLSSSSSSSGTVSHDGDDEGGGFSRSSNCDNNNNNNNITNSNNGGGNGGRLREGFQNGVNTNVNHESLIFSAAHSPAGMTTAITTQGVSPETKSGAGPSSSSSITITTAAMATTTTNTGRVVAVGEAQVRQRDYRETLLYGLIKSRALRRRTRSLSL